MSNGGLDDENQVSVRAVETRDKGPSLVLDCFEEHLLLVADQVVESRNGDAALEREIAHREAFIALAFDQPSSRLYHNLAQRFLLH